ncbi:MAG: squalene/phytoene synthase family protein [Chloroflexota bacterium]|nr:MAG: squalene synthase HpnC [Chloroflexota bacterium]
MNTITQLESADAYCRYLANRHYENFSVTSRILPADVRVHLTRLYAYCRTTDDLGDESGSHALPRLTLWREQVVQSLQEGPDPIHPVLLALRRSIASCDLPPQPLLNLIAANVQDQTVSEYGTWAELWQYCLLSAAPVGRLVLAVWGIREPEAQKLSDDVCIGLQLANFAQDVAVDRMKQRCYLVQADQLDEDPRAAVRSLCDRAERLLVSGHDLEELVPGPCRVQLALYRLGGMAILSTIRGMDYRTYQTRPRLSLATKLSLIPVALTESRRSRGHASPQGAT